MEHLKTFESFDFDKVMGFGDEPEKGSREDLVKDIMSMDDDKARNVLGSDHYIFLARPKYHEVEIGGEIYHKKGWDIEKMVKVDPTDPKTSTIYQGMRMRQRFQGDLNMYHLSTEKGLMNDDFEFTQMVNKNPHLAKDVMDKARKI